MNKITAYFLTPFQWTAWNPSKNKGNNSSKICLVTCTHVFIQNSKIFILKKGFYTFAGTTLCLSALKKNCT